MTSLFLNVLRQFVWSGGRGLHVLLCLAVAYCFISAADAASPPDKSGVKPSVISLPRGAGSIEGLGGSFQPQLNTGGSTYGISISLPKGRGGLTPSIHLGYNSFSGNGIAGIGWSLEFMSVKRETDKGFPEYNSGDTFVFGGEELVPLSNAEHDWRCENERDFNRLRQVDSDGDGLPDSWEVTERNGTKHTLGRFRGQNNRWSVVEHPEKASASPFDRVYSWMLDSTTDLHGNRIEYEYIQGTNVLYPSRITYSHLSNNVHEVTFHYENRPDAFDDYRPTFSARLDARLTRIEVRTRGQLVRAYNFSYSYAPGDLTASEATLQSTYLDLGVTLLKRVVEVDNSGNDANYLPPLVFTYSGLDLSKAEQRNFAAVPELDLADPNGRVQIADLDGDGLPDLFATTLEGATTVQRVALNRGESQASGQPQISFAPAKLVVSSSPVDLAEPNTVVHDPKGKGLVDMSTLVDDGGNKRLDTFGNRAQLDVVDENRLGFGQENLQSTSIANPPAFVTYSQASTRQMDVNFDKKGDFINLEPGFGAMTVNTFYIDRGGNWVSGQSTLPPSYPLANTFQDSIGNPNPCVHLTDMNGDRMLDLVCLAPETSGTGQRIRVSYWPLCGLGRYSTERAMATTSPDTFDIGNADLRDVYIEDFTGDGLADVLVLDGSGPETILTLRVNIAGQRWSPPYIMKGLPRYAPRDAVQPTVLRIADLNGNGSLDLLFRNTSPADSWSYVELLPQSAPSLMVGIDNGLGKRTSIVYGSAAQDEQFARESGHPWRTFAPISLQVVRQIRTSTSVDLNGDGRADAHVTEFRYRDPYYDGYEREFRGFSYAQQIDYGDDFLYDPVSSLMQVSAGWDPARTPTGQVSGPSLVTRYRFHTGAADQQDNDDYGDQAPPSDAKIDEFSLPAGHEEEALKGLELVREQVDPVVLHSAPDGGFDAGCEAAALAATPEGQTKLTPDSYVYTRQSQIWKLRRLYRPAEPIPYLADQNADGVLEDYRNTPAVPVPAGRFASQGISVLAGNGRSVTFAISLKQTTEVREANVLLSDALGYAPAPVATTTKLSDYDDYGNQVLLKDLGVDDPSFDDERVTTTTYALGGNALSLWVINQPDTISVTDENGAFVSKKVHFYDGQPFVGIQSQIQDQALLNRTVEYVDTTHSIETSRTSFDVYGNPETTKDPLGNIRRITYDPDFKTHPTIETKVVGGGSPDLVMGADYDYGFGVVTRSTDYNGNVSTYVYDSFGRMVKTILPGDSADLPTRVYEYQPCDPVRGRSFVYDPAGNLSIGAVPLGSISRVTTRQRQVAGQTSQLVTATYSDGDSHNVAAVEQSENPGTWVVKQATSYNLRGQVQSRWLPYRVASSDVPQFGVLWPSGRPPAMDGTNAVVESDLFYDPQGREIHAVLPPETWGGQRRETITQHLPFQEWTFDAEDTQAGSPRAGTPHIAYLDGLGRRIGVAEVVKLNDQGQPVSVTNRWLTQYRYDLNDELVRIADSQNNVKTMEYDGLKRKTKASDPDQGTTVYLYDDASNLKETIDAKGQHIAYTYDGVNRVLTEDYQDEASTEFSYHRSPDVSYFYDRPAGAIDMGDRSAGTARNTKGRLAYVLDASGEEHTSYDERGRVEWTTKRIPDAGNGLPLIPLPSTLVSYTTRYSYDSMDRVAQMVYPDNDAISYVYNARGLLQQINGGPSGKIIVGIGYRADGQEEQVQYGNGVRTTYQYDPRLRLTDLQTVSLSNSAPGELIHFHYDFDGVSNLKSIEDRRTTAALPSTDPRRNTQILTYDDLYRLTSVQYNPPAAAAANGGQIQYRYDRIGNLLSQSSDIVDLQQDFSVTDVGILSYGGTLGTSNRVGRTQGDPPGPHALSKIQNQAAADRSYPYDSNGSMVQLDGLHCTWDFKDRLVVAENDTMRAEYVYDYSDRRVIKRVSHKTAAGSTPSNSPQLSSSVSYPSRDFEAREHEQPVKYVFNHEKRIANITGTLASNNPRVQRVRLRPGWNLCSMAVGGGTLPASSGAAFAWNPSGNSWTQVSPGDLIPAGTVFWINSETNATLTMVGSYAEPTDRVLASGGSFQAAAGLEAWAAPTLNVNFGLWHYDSPGQIWQLQTSDLPGGDPAFPTFIAPGEALFINVASPISLVMPDPALRVRFYHEDHLSSSSVITDAQGALVEEIAYYPFGTPRHEYHARPVNEPYTFGQKELDPESGLYYFEARYLAGHLARFASADPKYASPDTLTPEERDALISDPQKLNLYSYVLNNPVKYHDPTGLEEKNKEGEKEPSPGEEVAEATGSLFVMGAEKDAAVMTADFVKHAYDGSPTGLKVVNTITAPVWVPVVVFGSATYSIGKDLYHVGRGTVRGAWSLGKSVVNHFRTVEAEPPPPLDLPVHEDVSMRSSSTAHEDAPPPAPKQQAPARPHPSPRPRMSPAPDPPRAQPRESSAREIERDRRVDY
jgi:RHS repeat-associated protein